MAETQAQRLGRIEEKIDKVGDMVGELATTAAVMHTKIEDLEVRREESHQRANKFSEKLDHMHDGIHELDREVKTMEQRVNIASKVFYLISAAVIAAVINEVANII